jgi:hypothetical protein
MASPSLFKTIVIFTVVRNGKPGGPIFNVAAAYQKGEHTKAANAAINQNRNY